MMELIIKEVEFPKEIGFNFEELKAEIVSKSALYKNMVYTDETIKEAKSDRATLNKFVAALEDKRKEVKKRCLAPYEEFEKQIKEFVRIVDEPVRMIDAQVKDYEDRKKAEKKSQIEEIFARTGFQNFVKLEQVFNYKWLNASVSLKKIEEELAEIRNAIGHDVSALNALPEFSFEALEMYKQTLNLSAAIQEGQRLADIQKRKLEYEAQRKDAEEARLKEEQQQAEALSEAQEKTESEQPDQELPKIWVRFAALVSNDDAVALRDFCMSKKITIKCIK